MSWILGVGELLWDIVGDRRTPGGAPVNFAYHCQQLGHRSAIISRIGADDDGQALRAWLQQTGIDCQFLQTDAAWPTGSAIAHGEPPGSNGYTITPDVAWDMLRPEWTFAEPPNAICFGTLAQRHPIARQSIRRLIDSLPDSTRVICDINLREPLWAPLIIESSLERANWLKLNHEEFDILGRWLRIPNGTLADRMVVLRQRYQLDLVCVTAGAAGAAVLTADECIAQPGVQARPGGDSIGAGDAFTAALLCRTLEGKTLAASMEFAVRYAAEVASCRGGTPAFDPGILDA